jgi:hypothetical protein
VASTQRVAALPLPDETIRLTHYTRRLDFRGISGKGENRREAAISDVRTRPGAERKIEMMNTENLLKKLATMAAAFACLLASPSMVLGGDLQPPGPPAPTMRTLDSLGFDCPNDIASNTTNLLYTFVTNQAGFDTGLTISNTSTDPFGTTAQAGSCTLHFYGASAPAPVSTGNIASGTTYTTLASLVAPNFQGYMIATCPFAFAHGFAFISDVGARNLAMGYLGQVICTDRGANAMGSGR